MTTKKPLTEGNVPGNHKFEAGKRRPIAPPGRIIKEGEQPKPIQVNQSRPLKKKKIILIVSIYFAIVLGFVLITHYHEQDLSAYHQVEVFYRNYPEARQFIKEIIIDNKISRYELFELRNLIDRIKKKRIIEKLKNKKADTNVGPTPSISRWMRYSNKRKTQ